MKKLFIIGTGGLAREVYWHAQNSIGYKTQYELKGFLEGDVPLDASKYNLLPMQVVDNVINYEIEENDVFIIAIADGECKEKIAKIIEEKKGEFINLIHNTALVSPLAKIGKGILICPFVIISCNTSVGNHVTFNSYSDLGHDAIVGDYTSIMSHVDITGNVLVGAHTFWGSGARALPSSKIGNYARIGAGSVVLRKVKDGQTVFGVPAMPI